MPIYARNSLGSNVKITANENYSYADMGRILSECVQNDMTLFNAVLLNDFKESTAIREGTMVSSELTAFREFSVKEAWGGLKKKLQKLWEKIKGVFRQVYAKLTVWLVRNGKAFVAMHRKTLANKTGLSKCKIPSYLKRNDQFLNKNFAGDIISALDKKLIGATIAGTTDARSVDALTNEKLQKAISDNDVTADTFAETFKKKAFTEMKNTTFGEIGVSLDQLFNNITTKSKAIKDLKKAERDADASIKKALKTLSDKEKEAEKAKEGSGENFKHASTQISSFERAITITTRAKIQAIKTGVAQDRMVVGKLVAYSPNNESAVLEEMAWLEGADDFASSEDIPAEEINADDVQSDPDVEINVTVDDDGNECSK